MHVSRVIVGMSLVLAAVVLFSGAMKTQAPNELEKRVELLELRVKKLESILFTTSQLTKLEAQQELEQAQSRLENSRRLHLRGFITAAQLETDRFRVQQARRIVDLSRREAIDTRLVGEIDMLEAERELQVAQDNFNHTQRLFDRGYVSEFQLDAAQERVRSVRRRLDLAKTKADAALELMKMDQGEANQQPASKTDKNP